MSTVTTANHPKILIIDDNKSIHEDFRKVLCNGDGDVSDLEDLKSELFGDNGTQLAMQKFDLDSAYQGQEGYAMVKQAIKAGRPYAMAFVDVRMPPGWDGIETIKHLWEEDPDLQIVICTAYSDRNWNQIVNELGKVDGLLILKKPFDSVEVIQLALALTTKWTLYQQTKATMASLENMVEDRTRRLSEALNQLEQETKEREQMELDLRLAQKLESIGQLAAGIAHEINTPTQYVADNTNFIKDSFDDLCSVLQQYGKVLQSCQDGTVNDSLIKETVAEIERADVTYLVSEIPTAIEQSIDGISRIANIVLAMKEFSHPGSKEFVNVDINHMIETTVTVARNEWKYVAEIDTDLDRTIPPIPCLPGEFSQVILNIIVNATHAIADVTEEGGKGVITISTRAVDGMVQIKITDTGGGIPTEIRDKIFDPFFTTKGAGKGTGQGLAIARSVIVDKLGGNIRCESQAGRGTTFTITLPISNESAGPPQEGV